MGTRGKDRTPPGADQPTHPGLVGPPVRNPSLRPEQIIRLLRRSENPQQLRKSRTVWNRLVRTGLWGQLAGYLGLKMHRRGPAAQIGKLPPRRRIGALQVDLMQAIPRGA